tara:strand:- start:1580 stop:1708 length:129 start_codon:yes stop_codon:yes gene_type:complete
VAAGHDAMLSAGLATVKDKVQDTFEGQLAQSVDEVYHASIEF